MPSHLLGQVSNTGGAALIPPINLIQDGTMKMDLYANKLVEQIYAGIKAKTNDKPRPHLGASVIGDSCDRKIWYGFRWINREDFDGRMLRLFRRGQDEELPLVKDLRAAGLIVDDINPTTKRQFGFKDGFFAGSCDGIIVSGVPEAPKAKHVLEIKTHSLKSFNSVSKDGVEISKIQHFAQMQVYMGKFGIERALYVAICKDNDNIYTERVRFCKKTYEALVDRAHRIIESDRIPEPLTNDPSWFECKFCSSKDTCHKGVPANEVHCRTCANITFNDDGTAHCQHWDAVIPFEAQLTGCNAHILHMDLVPYQMQVEDGGLVSWKIGETWVRNGERAYNVFSSKELLTNPGGCAAIVDDELAQNFRLACGGEVVG